MTAPRAARTGEEGRAARRTRLEQAEARLGEVCETERQLRRELHTLRLHHTTLTIAFASLVDTFTPEQLAIVLGAQDQRVREWALTEALPRTVQVALPAPAPAVTRAPRRRRTAGRDPGPVTG